MYKYLRRILCAYLKMLPEGLVVGTSGNLSIRTGDGNIIIKPSGVDYEEMEPDDMVVLDPSGKHLGGEFKPSVDAPAHLYIYQNDPTVFAVCHTHSPYATAFAMCEQDIPVCSTMMADIFGGPIPCIGVHPGDREGMGQALVESGTHAILLQNHGVLVAGDGLSEAFHLACVVEEAAYLQYLAKQIGIPQPLPEATVKRLHKQHQENYGQ